MLEHQTDMANNFHYKNMTHREFSEHIKGFP